MTSAASKAPTTAEVAAQPLDPKGVTAKDDAAAQATEPAVDRRSSKSAAILKLLRRKRGATLPELQAATSWQAHSVRGFLSGTVRKRLQLALTSEPGPDGVRRYRVAASPDDAASPDPAAPNAASEVAAASPTAPGKAG